MSVPPHVLAASLAVLGLHDNDMVVAHLTGDSLVDDLPAPEGTDRCLTFRNEAVGVDLYVTYTAGGRHLVVDVAPDDYSELVVVQPAVEPAVEPAVQPVVQPVVQLRRSVRERPLRICDVEPGLTSVVLRDRPDGTTHRTAWVVI